MRFMNFMVFGISLVIGRFLGEMDTDSLDASLADHEEALVMFYTDDWLTWDKIRVEFDAAWMSLRHEHP